jgi:alkaline phosphatase
MNASLRRPSFITLLLVATAACSADDRARDSVSTTPLPGETATSPAPTPPPTAMAPAATPPRRVVFFLGDGMGINVMTAARIYAKGETGSLAMDTLPETGFVRTYSKDSQVTDSAAGMTA